MAKLDLNVIASQMEAKHKPTHEAMMAESQAALAAEQSARRAAEAQVAELRALVERLTALVEASKVDGTAIAGALSELKREQPPMGFRMTFGRDSEGRIAPPIEIVPIKMPRI